MKKIFTLIALVAGIATVHADEVAMPLAAEAPLQLSLTPDIALHSRDTMIRGVSLNIWGENPQKSLTLGFINGSTGESGGFTWALLGNYADSYTGVAWGMVNYSKVSFVGWQNAIVNVSRGHFKGLQSAWVNVAEDATGLQWGLINYTERMNGVQLGFVNVIRDNPWFTELPDKLATGFPFVNWSF